MVSWGTNSPSRPSLFGSGTPTIPAEFGYVLLDVVALFLLQHIYMPTRVSQARKQYGVTYPTLYADSTHKHAKAYNCVQRAHQNALEYAYIALALLLIAGLRFPVVAASTGAAYVVGRFLYFEGYAQGAPKRRLPGYAISTSALLVLAGVVSYIAWELLRSG